MQMGFKCIIIIIVSILTLSCNNNKNIANDLPKNDNEQQPHKIIESKYSLEKLIGFYVDDNDFIQLKISNINGSYVYELNMGDIFLTNNIDYNFDGTEEYLVLKNIKWAYWEIDGEEQELPNDVVALITEDGLTIQNYGNAMNNFIIFDEIGDKYIELKKIENNK